MHDSRAHLSAKARQRRKVMQQGVDERAPIAGILAGSGSGMDHHASGLVDDGQVVVFIDDLQRNVFGHGPQRRPRRRTGYRDLLAATKLQRRPRRSPIHQNLLLGNELLHTGAAHLQLSRQKLIQAFASVFPGNGDGTWKSLGHFRTTIVPRNLQPRTQPARVPGTIGRRGNETGCPGRDAYPANQPLVCRATRSSIIWPVSLLHNRRNDSLALTRSFQHWEA